MMTPADIPRSVKFTAPGSVPSADRVRRVRAALVAELTAAAADHGLLLQPGADPDELLIHHEDLALPWLCDFVESSLKRVARRFPADLIGGANVTRLDRVITHGHPRLPYRRALRIAGSRGWRVTLGDDLSEDAAASLVRFCGLLPVQVMFLPGQPGPASLPQGCQGLAYVLPWAGEAVRGELPLFGGMGTCRFRVESLLQFVLGLDRNDRVRQTPPAAAGA
jgi:hypothetical protein